MTGKQAKQPKSRWQFAIGVTLAALLCSVSAWMVFKRFTVTAIVQPTLDPLPASVTESIKAVGKNSTPAPTATSLPPQTSIQPTEAAVQMNGTAGIRQGVFRVGNPTNYPVRVALLSRKTPVQTERAKGKSQSAEAGDQPLYELPAHWDFAPEEGGRQGLLVSLPDRALKLKKGDVLVAFAQDGSGRYWGPYVVDETAQPLWNAKAVEWRLILQP
ncbi:MAG: hypothetical protein H7Z11_15860 [Verrucomicrobia bacterium]|nr:hypothetical protein [Leptolyngbya sp. ES-bin-22]